ncbi:nucleotidyltransferase domain-containing protein [Streptomyces microflavus]|uniref:nucleotidyltransferase domain-containing protein n=1 Tax=Streptomyces microflavus TaxID=1919 RepID=UPI00225861A2|nr:nucleotidyltransferase domain-containing protein [Streptomyces microflavus]MCX4653747.1 nucleotidyltransferase domain-containing protein [Streptomyces microflavus]
MTTMNSSIIRDLRIVADRLLAESLNFEIYLFGSTAKGVSNPQDTDVAVIYPEGSLELAHLVAEKYRTLDFSPPIEVIALSQSEQKECDFLSLVEASLLWPLPESKLT